MKRIYLYLLAALLVFASPAHAEPSAVNGATSKCFRVFVNNSSVTTGAGLTGLAFNSGSLSCYYSEEAQSGATSITLATSTLGTYTSGAFKEVDATNMPGWYEFCPPNAALDGGIGTAVSFQCKGASNMAPMNLRVLLSPPTEVSSMQANTVTATAIASDAITAAKIAADSIGASELATDAIGAAELAADAIGASEIAADAIAAAEIANGAIDAATFATGAIDAAAIAADAIGASELAADAVGASELAADAIGASELASNAIGSAEIANGALTAPKFGYDGQLTSESGTTLGLASGAVTADDQFNNGVALAVYDASGNLLARACITDSTNSGDTVVTAQDISALVATGDNYLLLSDAACGGITLGSGAITASTFASDAITASVIAANAIGASELASDAITAAKIAADAIGASELAADAIGASELAADAIGAVEIANAAIDAATFATAAIDATAIAADAIGASEIAANAIGDSELGDTLTFALVGNITGNLSGSVGSVTGTIGGLTAAALKDFFDTDSTDEYADAVAGSVIKEIADNAAGGGGGTVNANIVEWDGDAVAAPHTPGYPICTVKDGTGTGEIDTDSGQVTATNGGGGASSTRKW